MTQLAALELLVIPCITQALCPRAKFSVQRPPAQQLRNLAAFREPLRERILTRLAKSTFDKVVRKDDEDAISVSDISWTSINGHGVKKNESKMSRTGN
jgi:hypothetical protein